jgi:hypothetical protein
MKDPAEASYEIANIGFDHQGSKKQMKEEQEALGEAEFLDREASPREKELLEEDALSARERRFMNRNSTQWGEPGPVQEAEWDVREAEWDVRDAEWELKRQKRHGDLSRDEKLAKKEGPKVKETKDGSELEKMASNNKSPLEKKSSMEHTKYKKNHSKGYGRKLNSAEYSGSITSDDNNYVAGGNSNQMTIHGEGSNVPPGALGGSYSPTPLGGVPPSQFNTITG